MAAEWSFKFPRLVLVLPCPLCHRSFLSQPSFSHGQTLPLNPCADSNHYLAWLILQLGWVMHLFWAQMGKPFLYFLHVPMKSAGGRVKLGRKRPGQIAWQRSPSFWGICWLVLFPGCDYVKQDVFMNIALTLLGELWNTPRCHLISVTQAVASALRSWWKDAPANIWFYLLLLKLVTLSLKPWFFNFFSF